jgi:hypothetical protein
VEELVAERKGVPKNRWDEEQNREKTWQGFWE